MVHILGWACFLKLSIINPPRETTSSYFQWSQAASPTVVSKSLSQSGRNHEKLADAQAKPVYAQAKPEDAQAEPYMPGQSPQMPGQPADIGEWPAGFSRLITRNMRQGAYFALC